MGLHQSAQELDLLSRDLASRALAPHPKIIELLRELLRHYPAAYSPELIPELSQARQRVKSEAVKRLITEAIDKITGRIPESAFEEWLETWRGFMAVGEERRVADVPKLLEAYPRYRKSVAMRVAILWSLVRCGSHAAIDLLLEALRDDELVVRKSAYSGLWGALPWQAPHL